MGIFLDTSNIEEIKKYHAMGIIRGVTTNPTILLKEGIKGGMEAVKRHTIEIARLINPLPLSVEVQTNDKEHMLSQAQDIASWAKNINVKITVHGPNGELDNLEVAHYLETKKDIRVNVTAMMSAQQCFLAAMAGATYVSIFGGRVNDMGYDAAEEVKKLRKVIDDFGLKAKIIVGSSREALNVITWFHAGAHIVTVAPKFLDTMIVHPYTKETVQQFLRDAQKAQQ